jgi:hypothetical protein
MAICLGGEMWKAVSLALVGSVFAVSALCEDQPVGKPQFPGSIQLLPGYKVSTRMGIESLGGEIFSRDMRIYFDVGVNTGNWTSAAPDNSILWQRKQMLHRHHVVCVYTIQKELIVTFPYLTANFRAKVNSKQDMADMLLMVLSYEPVAGTPPEPTVDSAGPQTQ